MIVVQASIDGHRLWTDAVAWSGGEDRVGAVATNVEVPKKVR